jgi:lipopolysaccharide transport system ATP-binding protein
MSEPVISVRNVSKRYQVFDSPRARLLHALWPWRAPRAREVWALRDIDLEVQRGEAVAIIGRNGGGKSTLLEIITGTLTPTTGDVSVQGRVAALLELGSGFNPEFTGRENVYLNGLLLGLSRDQITQCYDDILAFADIGDVLERPLKTYSSGMVVRLAFAVQIALQPQVLIVDEALSVGDYFFQQKCFGHLRKMREDGLTLLFVSHDMGTVRDLCARALYLRGGQAVALGDTLTVVRQYFADGAQARARPPTPASTPARLPVDGAALPRLQGDIAWLPAAGAAQRLLGVRLLDADDRDVTAARIGSFLRVRVYVRQTDPVPGLRIAVTLKNRMDQVISAQSSAMLGLEAIAIDESAYAVVEFEVHLQIEAGLYSFRVQISRPNLANRGDVLEATPWIGPLHVQWDYEAEPAPFLGMFGIPMAVKSWRAEDDGPDAGGCGLHKREP